MRSLLLVAVAIVVAGLAALMAHNWLDSQREAILASVPKAVEAVPMTDILVAAADLTPGQFVKTEQLRWQPWPSDLVLQFHIVRGRKSETDFVGAVARAQILAGEPVTETRMVKPGDSGFLAAVLDPGMRAVTIPLNPVSGVSGFVLPGDRVDLILTPAPDGSEDKRRFAATVLEGVRVLAIDRKLDQTQGEAQEAKVATLEVTPKMAEKIVLALELGSLSLSLRSIAADTVEEPEGAAEVPTVTYRDELFVAPDAMSLDAVPVAGAVGPDEKQNVVHVLRGGEASEVKF